MYLDGKTRLIVAGIFWIFVIVFMTIATGFETIKISFYLGLAVAGITLYLTSPLVQAKDAAQAQHIREMQEVREQGRNFARGMAEGGMQTGGYNGGYENNPLREGAMHFHKMASQPPRGVTHPALSMEGERLQRHIKKKSGMSDDEYFNKLIKRKKMRL